MRGGRLRKRLQVQTFTATPDGHGTPVRSWATVNTVWGSIEPVSGMKTEIGGGMDAERITHKITVRFFPGFSLPNISTTYRIAYQDFQQSQPEGVTRIFQIKSALNPDERRISQVLMCMEGAPNA